MENQLPEETRQIDIINKKITEAIKEIEKIAEQKAKIRNPNDLEALEKKIITATDKLAGLITAQKIQQNLDSEGIKQQSKELIKNLPKKMKNQGEREVEITPSRGEPIKVKATYYSQKKKNKVRRKKKR